MGESNRNPMSPGFKGKMPDFAIQGLVNVAFEPMPAYLERHKEAIEASRAAGEEKVELPPLTDEETFVVVRPAVQFVVPSRVLGRHPAAIIPAGEVRIPLTEIKKAAKACFEAQGDAYLASLVKIADGGN